MEVTAYPVTATPTVATSDCDEIVNAGFASFVANVYVAVAEPDELVAVIV